MLHLPWGYRLVIRLGLYLHPSSGVCALAIDNMSAEPGLNTDVLWTRVPQIGGSGLSSNSQAQSYFLGHSSREAMENRFIQMCGVALFF